MMYSPENEAIDRIKLKLAGYNFEYFTHYHRLGRDLKYFSCYDFGIQFLNNNKVRIICFESINPPDPGP